MDLVLKIIIEISILINILQNKAIHYFNSTRHPVKACIPSVNDNPSPVSLSLEGLAKNFSQVVVAFRSGD
jgi:hypothetical protein